MMGRDCCGSRAAFVGKWAPSYFHGDTTWVDHFSGRNNLLFQAHNLAWSLVGPLFLLGVVVYHISIDTDSDRWVIYLTDWSLLLQMAFFLVRVPTVYCTMQHGPPPAEALPRALLRSHEFSLRSHW